MVVKLEGKIEGQDIIFQRKSGDWWETTIPRNLVGSYAVELIATDEAGNIGFATKYLLTVDISRLHVCLVPIPYSAHLIKSEYSTSVMMSNYYAVLVKDDCGR